MRKALMLAAGIVAVLAAGPAEADKKQLAIVVPGRDNPYYDAIGDGCAKWNADNKASPYECVFAGPTSSADTFGEIQIVDDFITAGAAAIAIAPGDGEAMAKLLRDKLPWMPISAIDVDFPPADRDVRRVLINIDNYQVGRRFAQIVAGRKPTGGSVCLQLGKANDQATLARAAGLRDALAAKTGVARLTGQNGWSEPDGCPLFSADGKTDDEQLGEMLAANPKLDVLVIAGGSAEANPTAYAKALAPVAARIKDKSLVILGSDVTAAQIAALKAGRSVAQIGVTAFDLGRAAPDVMIELIHGADVSDPAPTPVRVCTQATAATCLK